jgi:hypothetical protein
MLPTALNKHKALPIEMSNPIIEVVKGALGNRTSSSHHLHI